jgi:hypothetical protein
LEESEQALAMARVQNNSEAQNSNVFAREHSSMALQLFENQKGGVAISLEEYNEKMKSLQD